MYERYKNADFKCGEDDDGVNLRIKLKYFFEYLVHNKDDSPLYVFESSLEENQDIKALLNDYQVPSFF